MQDSFNQDSPLFFRSCLHMFDLHTSRAVTDLQNIVFQLRKRQVFYNLAFGLIL